MHDKYAPPIEYVAVIDGDTDAILQEAAPSHGHLRHLQVSDARINTYVGVVEYFVNVRKVRAAEPAAGPLMADELSGSPCARERSQCQRTSYHLQEFHAIVDEQTARF